MISKKAIALCATVGVALTGFAIATPANAEPVSNSYVAVGSDTLEDVVSALANGSSLSGSSVRSTTAGGATIGSFDATGTAYITTKSSGVRFGRPNGSGDGRTALLRSIDGAAYTSGTVGAPAAVVISGQVDIARSSGSGTVDAAGSLIQVPFGRDAIAYAYDNGSTATGIDTIDTATMTSLYTCSVTTLGGVTVTPIIPQAGSGTRKDFMAKIGVTDATLGSCVQTGQEHDASNLGINQIMPMSVSRWVAMNTGASYPKKKDTTVLGSLVAGTTPVTGTGTSMVPNATYYADSVWGRDTYLVVQYARVDPTNASYDATLAGLLDPTKSTSLTNSQTSLASKAGSLKKKFGILAPSTTTAVRISK
ncbi:hypothetical protein E3O55_02235 [Cryobacterium sp. MDB1-18-2]|uniref:hypothetical protein n=1 Tax=unclassified Cryobacterium TaxID=2649013 RepID=UPI00106914E2|nr:MULTISPECIES: hypothetical protein [unclassified Cryobacterium]TFC34844.1 hypothetical protein E3O55_02235 [Cryobacterium sp. MDB1-18-2]TFC37355.1 hypothetical protein E3O50_18170 [Cryobacterium sp. MDB1-18-1]